MCIALNRVFFFVCLELQSFDLLYKGFDLFFCEHPEFLIWCGSPKLKEYIKMSILLTCFHTFC